MTKYHVTMRDFYCLGCRWVRYKRGLKCQCHHPLVTTAPLPLIHGQYRGGSAREQMDMRVNYHKAQRMFKVFKAEEALHHPDFRWPWDFVDAAIESCGGKEVEDDD